MFKSKKKRQQQKDNIVVLQESVADVKQYQLDDIPLAHDFRSSTILPQLSTTLSNEHSVSPLMGSANYYEQLAAWRHEKNQNRYSNGLFGGKHRGRPHTKREAKGTETQEETVEQRQLYEPDSEEENYFFQDFSAGSTNIKKKSKKVNKACPPPVKAFDLSSFAQDLHDNRLSMVQSRSSKIVMTEEDERQLEELLKKRSESTDSFYMPLPTAISKSQSTPSNRPPSVHSLVFNKESSEKLEIEDDVPDLKPVNKPTDGTPINILSHNNSIRSQLMRSPSLNSIQEHSAFTTSLNASLGLIEDNRPKSLKKSSSTASIIKPPITPQRSIRRARSNTSIESIPQSPIQPAFETIQEENTTPKPSKRGLLGSLRQVSRSKTTSASLKGLVRNLSHSSSQRPASTPGMSRAAMAVLEHEKKKEEEKREEEEDKPNVTRLISQFMSKAARQKKNTKFVNMKDKSRAKVLRRTIIYVQPDSLHDVLKPNYKEQKDEHQKDEISSELMKDKKGYEGAEEDEQKVPDVPELPKEYTTATKIVRQASVRKRVDRQDNRWQLQSMDETELLSSEDKYLEGVELREMSDGSVVWGIVKQQGNRKSFFAPNQNNEYEHLEDEIAPPPIPKRSPKRKADRETTDIYYSNDMSLPHLLKMMQDSHPGDEPSVDDQLDEMMRILTSQQ